MGLAIVDSVRDPEPAPADRDISSGTFKIWEVAGLFQQSFEALAKAAASSMQASRALDVLFDARAAQHRGAAPPMHPFGVGFKRPRQGWTGLPVPQW